MQNKVLETFLYNKKLKFNQIEKLTKLRSNKLAYYLKNLIKNVDLEGTLEVTEIGSRVTQNLLNSIDPSGTDSSVRSVRKMISLGYKPNSISFQIRHGYFYPSIFFSQPWYSPIRIAGGKVSISRLPVKFILDLMAAEKKLIMQ